jgi:hypothetical protein
VKTKTLINRCMTVLVSVSTMLVFVTPAPAHAITGRNYSMYNGDVCYNTPIDQFCAFNDGDMTKGTLSVAPSYRWRAGSGSGQSTNRCATDVGPIPFGDHQFRQHLDNKNDTIKGRAWWLYDMHCVYSNPNSTLRLAMFIHTEETASQGQSCPTSGDDPYCWDADYDYYSNGCVKVKYLNDVGSVDARWHANYNNPAILSVDV